MGRITQHLRMAVTSRVCMRAPMNKRPIIRAFATIAAILALVASGAANADSLSMSSDNGFGRMVFALDPPAHMKAAMTDGVLTLTFDRKVTIDPAAIAQSLSGYVSSARADADGLTFRLALSQSVKLHTSVSANRIAVDLAPETFAGAPPDLPPPPPKEASAVDVAKLAPLTIRTGAYANFSRVVFDWPKNVPYAVFPGAGHLTIRFEAMARPDFAGFERVSPPWVKDAGWRIENKGTVIEFETDADSGYHDFRDGTKIVLDIVAPKADADAYNPPGDGKNGTKPMPTKLSGAARNGASAAQAQAIADAAEKLRQENSPPDAAKPAAVVPTTASAKTTPAPAAPTPTAAPAKSAATTPAPTTPAAQPAPQQSASAAPAAQAQPVDASLPQAQRTRVGAIVSLPGAATHASAVFVRGMTAWIVVDSPSALDFNRLKTQLGDFPTSVDASSGNGVNILRIGLKQPEQIAARADGSNLTIVLAPDATPVATAIGFVRNDGDPKRPSLVTLIPGATHIVALADPAAGDSLIVVPAAPGRAMLNLRSYAEFAALPTASGLVLVPFTDDLDVRVSQSRVTIASPSGLALTPPALSAADSPAALSRVTDGPCFLDLAAWSRSAGNNFLKAQRRLRENLAGLKPEEASQARTTLARFYLGNGFAAEALGLINLTQASDPSLQSDMQLQTMHAAANFMMGRYRDAHNDLAGQAFDNDRHAALWRGLTEAALENWDGARKSFALADPVLGRYPADWQARARVAEAKTALASGSIESADAALARLPQDLPKPLMLEAQLARAGLFAQEGRYHDAAALFAAIENSGDERAAAEAIYANVEAGLAAGAISQDTAIATLDQLRFRWRGDALELRTLRKLGALYFGRQRWREGLQILRVASQNFPNNDLALQAQDDMRACFENLFLKGKADAMAPVAALALFFDFIDLTPIGPNGDEMIRRMADRLVAVDLLGPAEQLLNYQVTKRLDGVGRAQVATRLAMIDLMDHKPKEALEALRTTRIAGLPDDINHQRNLLEARALAALKQWDQAIDMIAVDDAPETRQLRADIYWESGNWAVAAQKAEELVGDRWSDGIVLTPAERQELMRSAIAYSLANDQAGLDRLRGHFDAKMKASPDASAFALVTQNIDSQGTAFRDLAGKIASVDTLETFMQDFRKRYDAPKATN
jgi:hypothetical protein